MTLRTRFFFASAVAAMLPLVGLAAVGRALVEARLRQQYAGEVEAMQSRIRADLATEAHRVALALRALGADLAGNNTLRRLLADGTGDRRPLLDYGPRAMRMAGLDALQIQDPHGRILTSGHFRNAYDRLEPEIPRRLASAPDTVILVRLATPDGAMAVLARVDSVPVGGQTLTLVGGVRPGPAFLSHLAGGTDLALTLEIPGEPPRRAGAEAGTGAVTDTLILGLLAGDADGGDDTRVRFVTARGLGDLRRLRRTLDASLLIALLGAVGLAVLVSAWLTRRVTQPIAALARKADHLDVDRLDVRFEAQRDDEVGSLARLLDSMVGRLRRGTGALREAERRATLGELARQVHHDIRNGLAPLRHVFRHFDEVAADPEVLARVFEERRTTVASSLEYLETLSGNYARLSPVAGRERCGLGSLVNELVTGRDVPPGCRLRSAVDDDGLAVAVDPLLLRRVLENLISNAIDSLEGAPGSVRVSVERDGSRARIVVEDSGCGMTRDQLNRAFESFQTTKATGTGLGLSIARRLVTDMQGTIRLETEPGVGTRATLEFPAA